MAIGTGAAILGAAAIGGGASMLGASKAANASQKATDATLAMQQKQYDQTRTDLQPFTQTGYAANSALASRLGLSSPGASSTGATATPSTVPNYSNYLAANPDIATEAQRVQNPNGQNTPETGFTSVPAYLSWHDQNFANENRASTPNAPPAPAAPTPASTAATAPLDQPGTYGNTQNPSFTTPEPYAFDVNSFADNPIIKAAIERGTDQVLASNSATGSLQSGAALKQLQSEALKTAYGFYDNERNFGYGQYKDDRNFNYGKYVDDRNYLTDRFDTQTNNLFNLNASGQNAAGMVANAGANATGAMTGALANNAATRGSAYLASAGAVNNTLNNAAKTYAYYG